MIRPYISYSSGATQHHNPKDDIPCTLFLFSVFSGEEEVTGTGVSGESLQKAGPALVLLSWRLSHRIDASSAVWIPTSPLMSPTEVVESNDWNVCEYRTQAV
jgi:hypothetical protein